MFKVPLSRLFKGLPEKIKKFAIPAPKFFEPPEHKARSTEEGSHIQGKSRLDPRKTEWYSKLSDAQRECYYIIVGFTNWQLTQWNRDGCPHTDDPDNLRMYAELERVV